MQTFMCNFMDKEARGINPRPVEIQASGLGHALQKVAAMLPDDAVEVQVWKV